MRTHLFALAIGIPLALAAAPPARAQSSAAPLEQPVFAERPPGWSVIPALNYAFIWDSNVLFENIGSEIVGENLHVLKPRGALSFLGRRADFEARYNGAFVQHTQLASLDSYDQRLNVNARRRFTRRTSLFGRYLLAMSPTTELTELVGVPFLRIGSRLQIGGGGVDVQLGRRSELTASYRFQQVDFDEQAAPFQLLIGGRAHGAVLGFRHALTSRAALTADYDIHRAELVDGESYGLQNASAGMAYRLSPVLNVFGSLGVSHLGAIGDREPRLGPAIRLGLTRDFERVGLSIVYGRSYVPSFGFGGTNDNEELTFRAQAPLARRVLAHTSVAWRRNQPLEVTDLRLRSLWFYGSVGYLLNDWMRLEGFAGGTRQAIDRPGGRTARYHVGVQITAGTLARMR